MSRRNTNKMPQLDEKAKKILRLLEGRLTPQELDAVAEILAEPVFPDAHGGNRDEDVLSEDMRRFNPTTYQHYPSARNFDAGELRRKQEKVEREWRARRDICPAL